jgi:hypothetical protein
VPYSFNNVSEGLPVPATEELREGNCQIAIDYILGRFNRVVSNDWVAANRFAEDVRKV